MNISVNWDRIPSVMHTMDFEISGDPDWSPYPLLFTDAVEDAITASSEAAHKRSAGDAFAQKIRQFAQQFPSFPMFKNHLFNHYYLNQRPEEAQKVLDECLEAHPDYYYNGIMQGSLWMRSDADRPKLPTLMRDWNIVAYAGRDKFAEHEVRAYCLLAAEYHLICLQPDEADKFVYFLEVLCAEPDHPNIRALRAKLDETKPLLEGLLRMREMLGQQGRRRKKK